MGQDTASNLQHGVIHGIISIVVNRNTPLKICSKYGVLLIYVQQTDNRLRPLSNRSRQVGIVHEIPVYPGDNSTCASHGGYNIHPTTTQ